MHFRNKRRKAKADEMKARHERMLRELPPEAESKNKGKRKRQLQQMEKAGRTDRH